MSATRLEVEPNLIMAPDYASEASSICTILSTTRLAEEQSRELLTDGWLRDDEKKEQRAQRQEEDRQVEEACGDECLQGADRALNVVERDVTSALLPDLLRHPALCAIVLPAPLCYLLPIAS